MDNKILKYISRLDIDSISSLSDVFFDLVDSAIDGNTKFLVSTPEEYKEYLGIKEELVLNPVYDDFTKKAIYRYIYEFQWLFSGILTNKQIVERRPGDIDACYASTDKAYKELGFKAQYNIEDMCRDSYNYVLQNK